MLGRRISTLFALGLGAACSPASPGTEPAPLATERLAETPISDSSFSFEATRTVTLELSMAAPELRGAVPVEIIGAGGRTLFQGPVSGLRTELRLPVATVDHFVAVVVDGRSIEVALDAERIAVGL